MAGMTGGSAELRIVLLGKTGAGKSSTANRILREKLFTTSCYGDSDTATCKAATNTVDGRKITVIDTPGYFSTECPDEELIPEIAKCIVECSPGPHAFLIVLAVGRQTPEEIKTVKQILKMFGEGALKYAVVLFTHGEQLDDNVTIQEFVDKNDHLKTLVQKCGNRLHVIDNKYWNNPTEAHDDETRNDKEIQKLMSTIDQMVEQNGNKHYTNEMLQAVAQAIEAEMFKIREETGAKSSESTVNDMAKEKVKSSLIKLGVSTGVLLGALLGALACVGAVAVLVVGLEAMCMAGGGAAAAAVVVTKGVVAASKATGIGFGVAAGVVTGAGACVGGIAGGIAGAKAAKEAQSPIEAVEKAFLAVTDPAVVAGNIIRNQIEETVQKHCKKGSYSSF